MLGFYGTSTIVGYLMPNPLYTEYILNIYLYWIYIEYILNIYDFVWFYGKSIIIDYLMPSPLYTYMLNIYDLLWLGFMAYQPL